MMTSLLKNEVLQSARQGCYRGVPCIYVGVFLLDWHFQRAAAVATPA